MKTKKYQFKGAGLTEADVFYMRLENAIEAEKKDSLRSKTDVSSETQPTREQQREQTGKPQLTCERCGNKTDAGAWLGFVYVGAECLTESDKEYLE